MLYKKYFDNKNWRKLIKEVCSEISGDYNIPEMDVISPFGFELTDNKAFLSTNLRRFYCYVGVKNQDNYPALQIEEDFVNLLLTKLKNFDRGMYDDIIMKITKKHGYAKLNNTPKYVCKYNDKLVEIELRTVKSDILSDYADYVITALDIFLSKTADFKFFNTSKSSRSRIYQLYVMIEALYGKYVPNFTPEDTKLYNLACSRITNIFQEFMDDFPETSPEQEDIDILTLLDKRTKLINNTIKQMTLLNNKENNITVSCLAYHVPDNLEVKMPQGVYQELSSKVKTTYSGFIFDY